MRDGFVRVAAGTPDLSVCDVKANAAGAIGLMQAAADQRAKLLVLPELSLTGATCGDLFLQPALLRAALSGLAELVEASGPLDILTIIGLPIQFEGALYNCAAAVKGGNLLGVMPKRNPDRVQARWFARGGERARRIRILGRDVPFDSALTLACESMPEFSVAVAMAGDEPSGRASVLACPWALPELAGGPERARLTLSALSARRIAGCVMASAGPGESTTDSVYSGRRMIHEAGKLVLESAPFDAGLTVTELDLGFLESRRCADGCEAGEGQDALPFTVRMEYLHLTRAVDPSPFAPADRAALAARCEQILGIQVESLVQRMRRIHAEVAVLGVSGGLDSTLAMIVSARALAKLGLPAANLRAVTMPCFGTTDRTKSNARRLSASLGSALREINIAASVTQHFLDIGHDIDAHDAAYENAQARERTQVLMDLANMEGGLVVGTGDLSEMALGWTTYNGDHMSMYGVNGGVPKTLIRHIVRHVATSAADPALRDCLLDILDTPVSPELLPPTGGDISQKTEELVGPYELHDFFLYHMVRRMAGPAKLRRLALAAFEGAYESAEIDKWLRTFLRRFFSQQFKRNCMPEGPAVGPVTLSPRGGYSMPGDASARVWLDSLQ